MKEKLIKNGSINPFLCTKGRAFCPSCHESNQTMVELNEMSADGVKEFFCDEATILYIRQGSVCLSGSRQEGFLAKEGQLLFLSPGEQIRMKAETDSRFLTWKIKEIMLLADCLKTDEKEDVTEINSEAVTAIDANQHIRNMLTQFTSVLEEGLSCSIYVKLKLEELLILMRLFYSKALLASFFSPLLTIDYSFKKKILLQHNNARTVEELASMLNLSRSGFHQHFKRVLGKSPSRWMNEEKARQVLYELTITSKPIKQIWVDQGFSSASYFNQFCKKYLGNTPARIRKG